MTITRGECKDLSLSNQHPSKLLGRIPYFHSLIDTLSLYRNKNNLEDVGPASVRQKMEMGAKEVMRDDSFSLRLSQRIDLLIEGNLTKSQPRELIILGLDDEGRAEGET